jgi:hypothetical protein
MVEITGRLHDDTDSTSGMDNIPASTHDIS